MAGTLWDKGGVSDAEMMRYTARDDHLLDQKLLPFDIRATAAHVRGLGRIGVLSESETETLADALRALGDEAESGRFVLTADDEDGHTAIEARLQERLGALGKKVHTGRSRNDQVLVALRLYEKEALESIGQ